MKQYYRDHDGHVTCYTDKREQYHSQKVKPEHITIVSGKHSPQEIADDINKHVATSNGKVVGYLK